MFQNKHSSANKKQLKAQTTDNRRFTLEVQTTKVFNDSPLTQPIKAILSVHYGKRVKPPCSSHILININEVQLLKVNLISKTLLNCLW